MKFIDLYHPIQDMEDASLFSLEEPGLLYYGILIPLTIPVAAFFLSHQLAWPEVLPAQLETLESCFEMVFHLNHLYSRPLWMVFEPVSVTISYCTSEPEIRGWAWIQVKT